MDVKKIETSFLNDIYDLYCSKLSDEIRYVFFKYEYYCDSNLLEKVQLRVREFVISNYLLEHITHDYERYKKKVGRWNSEEHIHKSYILLLTKKNKFYNNYPLFEEKIRLLSQKVITQLSFIFKKYTSDIVTLSKYFNIEFNNLIDINFALGDWHNNLCTCLIKNSCGKQIVLKPTNGGLAEGYYKFISWINQYVGCNLKAGKILDRTEYHWMQFIATEDSQNINDIKEYYYSAGMLIFLTYFLNSRDLHYENLIASRSCPIIIDLETIVQSEPSQLYVQEKSLQNSVYDSSLLPDYNNNWGIPFSSCGLGCKFYNLEIMYEKGINNFGQLGWKFYTKIVKKNMILNNIPTHNQRHIYINNYRKEVIKGFEDCYLFFLNNKSLLTASNSPLSYFSNKEVRFIWRPTHVYSKIMKHVFNAINMDKCKLYAQKQIYEYLSRAYKEKDSRLLPVFMSEVDELSRCNIPYFTMNTSSKLMQTKFGRIRNVILESCIDKLYSNAESLSKLDMNLQINKISSSLVFK